MGVLDTAAAMLVYTGDTVTTLARGPLMPNPKLMLDTSMVVMVLDMAADTDMAWEDTTEDMVDTVLDLDTEDMAVSGVRHSEVQLPIAFRKSFHPETAKLQSNRKTF